MKAKSVLYRNLSDDDSYKREAIGNEFSRNDFTGIGKPKNLREYRPLCSIDDMGIWQHKGGRGYYVCTSQSNKVPSFASNNQRGLFMRTYGGVLMDAYAANILLSDSFLNRQKILEILNLI